MSSVLGAVDVWPSAPPSVICTWFISQIERLPSFTMPGTMASKELLPVHVPPIAVDAVEAQVYGHGNGMSTTVPEPVESRSVIRRLAFPCSCPV